MHGLAGGAVPHHGGLALVGDADRGDVLCGEVRLLQRLAAGGDRRSPDVLRLVLDPARRWKMLRELGLRYACDRDVGPKHNGARGRGALIDGQHKGHGVFPHVFSWRCFPGADSLRQGKRIGARRSTQWRCARLYSAPLAATCPAQRRGGERIVPGAPHPSPPRASFARLDPAKSVARKKNLTPPRW